jgi:hypothetical protein
MTINAKTSAGAHVRTPDWLIPDPRWEEQKARLWSMTPDERVRAMHAGELSLRLCLHWASRRPSEVPLVNGEFAFVALYTPEAADERGQRELVTESLLSCPPRPARGEHRARGR